MSSKVTFWKLDKPLPFRSVAGAVDALQIVQINGLTRDGATITYFEGHQIADDKGVVQSIDNLSNGQLRQFEWNDASFVAAKTAKLADIAAGNPSVDRESDQFLGYYTALAASRPEYAGQLITEG